MSANTNSQHMMSYGKLAAVLIILLIFTGITVGVSYIDMGVYNVPVTLGIASFKVSLVLLFFMHLKYESLAIKVSFLSTIGFLAIMIGLTFVDIAYR